MYIYMYIYMLMRGVEGRSQTNNKAKQHSTPKLPVPVQVVKHWLRIYIIMGLSPAQGSSSMFKHCLLYFGLLSTFMYDYTCTWLTMLMYMYVCVLPGLLVLMYMFLMRDERKKQAMYMSY